jgi:hypothetical protein
MTPARFPLLSVAFCLLIILVSAVACIVSLRHTRRLKMPTIYLGYCAVAGFIQFILRLSSSPQASYSFWPFELLNTIAIFIVALELFYTLFSKLAPLLLIVISVMVGFLTVGLSKPINSKSNLEVNLETLIMVGLVLTVFAFPHKDWTRETKSIFWGTISLVVLSLISSLLWLQNLLGVTGVFFSQLSPLPGLLCFAFARENEDSQMGSGSRFGLAFPNEDPSFENKLIKKTAILALR